MAAFNYLNFQRWSQGYDLQNNTMWNYSDSTTAIATITASAFFNSVNINPDSPVLNINDLIYVEASDAAEFIQVTAITPDITTSPFQITIGTGAVGTTNLAANAVTAAKIANNTITDTQVAVNGLTSASLDLTTIQYVKVPVTAAQFKAAYGTPFVMIAAPGASKMIVIKQAVLAMTYVSAQYTAGGATGLQYDTTAHLAGPLASATIAAATINAYAATSDTGLSWADTSGASSAKVNKGIYLSNDTAAFATGDGTFNVHIWYSVVTL